MGAQSDSFFLASSAPITEVKWRGGFGYGNSTNSITGFTVTFYSSIGGNSQPDIASVFAPNPLATYTVSGNPGQTSAGNVGGYPMYDYDLVLPTPFQATAGTVYWIQIEAAQAGIPDWCLAGGSGGNGSYFRRFAYIGDLYFTMGPGDAAFTLLTADTAIYSVAASASPAASGTIAGAGLFPTGVAASLVATPATNFAFVNWTQNGAVVSSSANYSFAVISNRTLVANFAAGSSITTLVSPASGGSVTGGGSYTNGTSVTLTATTNANYTFVNWTENGTQVSTSKNYTFTVSSNRTLTANFSSATANPAVYYSQPPAAGGLILSSFLSPDGMDGDNYCFDDFVIPVTQDITEIRWFGTYQYGNLVSDFTIRIYSSITGGSQPDIGSVFAANPLKSYTVGGNAGETFTNGMYAYDFILPSSFHAVAGTRYWVQIEASQTSYPNGWSFIHGSGGNGRYFLQVTGSTASLAAGDAAFMLIGAAGTNSSTITTVAQPAGGGFTSGDGAYANGLTNTVSAVAASGYAFAGWSANGVTVSTNATYSFTVSTNLTLSAIFNPTFAVSLTASPAAGGTVTGAGTYLALASVSAVAHTNAGYNFVNWTEAGVPVSTATNYNFTVAAARTLVANFAPMPVPMSMTNSSRTNLSLSWNPAITGWVLQESPDLITWTNSTRLLTTNGSQRSVSITPLGGNKFFRIMHP
jgi:Divergent InlB B-repeat domain